MERYQQGAYCGFSTDAKQETYGADPADRRWLECFVPRGLFRLRRYAASKAAPESQFKACTVSFAGEVTLSQVPRLDVPILTGRTR